MLDHVALADDATRLRAAVLRTLEDNVRTGDLGGTASTSDFTAAIIARLDEHDS